MLIYRWLVVISLIGCMVSIACCTKVQKKTIPVVPSVADEEPVEALMDVLIYTGNASWLTLENAIIEAKTTKKLLGAHGITATITDSEEYLRDWMIQTTANGDVNVCILYGILPSTIYPSGNAQPDGSVAENWIESTDGNTILNHADYFGYNSSEGKANERGAMQNLMDIPDIEINVYEHNVGMVVTTEGKTLTPSLNNFASDRPFSLNQFEGDWFAEKVLATDSEATVADPIIVRDGDRGRLAIVFHTLYKNNPKGEVAAEIINYLLAE